MKHILIYLIFISSVTVGLAQIMPHARPVQYNGGFTGMAQQGRVSTYWESNGIIWNHLYASYDQLVPKLRGGLALNVSNTTWCSNRKIKNFWSHEIGLTYSPKFISKNGLGISPFITPNLLSINYSEIFFPWLMANNTKWLNFHIKYGVLINKEDWYAGMFFDSFITSFGTFFDDNNNAFTDGNRLRYLNPNFQFGKSWDNKKHENRNTFVDANVEFNYLLDSSTTLLNHFSVNTTINAGVSLKKWMLGGYTQNFTEYGFLAGFKGKNFIIRNGIGLGRRYGLVNRISLQYVFPKSSKKVSRETNKFKKLNFLR